MSLTCQPLGIKGGDFHIAAWRVYRKPGHPNGWLFNMYIKPASEPPPTSNTDAVANYAMQWEGKEEDGDRLVAVATCRSGAKTITIPPWTTAAALWIDGIEPTGRR